MASPRSIVILGSTGSIGTQTLDVVRRLGMERARVVGLAAGSKTTLLAEQAREFGVKRVVVADSARAADLAGAMAGAQATARAGDRALVELATLDEADTVVVAVAGAAGLAATLAAARQGKRICIATKEVFVAAGELVTRTARENGATILPVDSEHSAIFQCIQGYRADQIRRIYLTGSGGPFRTWTAEQIREASIEDALRHPTWRMGGKITIDSATLMNKGLEVIEAAWLFEVPAEAVEVVIHPQSVVHSMVETVDGALLAQLGMPDMRLPIQIALMHPEKIDSDLPRLTPAAMGPLTFEAPDTSRFPALLLARRAAETGGTAPAVLNAANEAAVASFLQGRIAFTDICSLVGDVLDTHTARAADTLESVLTADAEARAAVAYLISQRTDEGTRN